MSTQSQLLQNLDEACDAFEAAWCAGLSPRIEEYLEGLTEPLRSRLFSELIALEISYCRQHGLGVDCTDHEKRFPNDILTVRAAYQSCHPGESTSPPSTALEYHPEPSSGLPAEDRYARGSHIGRYTVERKLGQGAYGTVYLACDDQLQRAVAIKIPRRASALNPVDYLKEARTTAKLSHATLVTVYDAGQLDDGTLFLVMEYVDGSSLQERLAGEKFSHLQVAEWLSQVADGVHHAHLQGFIHRDLKPANILIDREGHPRITDFGLALHETVQQNHRGDASGTPLYMSPEQVRGAADQMDGRCDIWALGVVLYESLTGRRPFRNRDEIELRDPKPPRQIDDRIPQSLERICLTCLAKSAVNRYPTADAVARHLRLVCQEMTSGNQVQLSITRDAQGNAIISGPGNVVFFESRKRLAQIDVESSDEANRNPYQGLLAFEETDADRFFGREEQTRRLWDRLCAICEQTASGQRPTRLLPVLGPSGCGKSSLVRAGLVAELARRPLPGWKATRVALFSPGARPLERLARVLAQIAPGDATAVETASIFERLLAERGVSGDYDGLRRIAERLPDADRSPLILLVDQFEEIYSLGDEADQRSAFIENLLHAASASGQLIVVVLTLRSDFLGDTQDHEPLNRLISQDGMIVPAMSEEDLRKAIVEPARQANQPFDLALVDLLLEQTRDHDGALPLLQFALTRIWEGIVKGVDPVETLKKMGGVGGALAGEADRIYNSLEAADQVIARRLFLKLLQLGEGTHDTGRQASLAELLTQGDDPAHIRHVIAQFATPGTRLITLSGAPGGDEYVQVSHEALFDHWTTLKTWTANSRDEIRFFRRLDDAARHWDDGQRPVGLLWRPPDLDLLRRYCQPSGEGLTPIQQEFCSAADQHERSQTLRAQRRVRFYEIVGLVVAGLAASVFCLSLLYQQQAKSARLQNYLANLQLAYAAWEERDLVRTHELLKTSLPYPDQPDFAWSYLWGQSQAFLNRDRPNEHSTFAHDGRVTALTLSNDGQRLAAGGSNQLRVWSTTTGELVWETSEIEKQLKAIALSSDGTQLVSAGRSLRIWNITDGNSVEIPKAGVSIRSLAYSADGKLFASGHGIGIVKVWNAETHEQRWTLSGHNRAVKSLMFSRDGSTLASGAADCVQLWDVATGDKLASLSGRAFAFSPNGRILAIAGRNRYVRMWDVSDNRRITPLPGFKASSSIATLAFVNDNFLAVTYDGNQWEICDIVRGDFCGELRGGADAWTAMAFSRDGSHLAWATYDGEQGNSHATDQNHDSERATVRVWHVTDSELRTQPASALDLLTSVAVTGDDKSVVAATGNVFPPYHATRGVAQRFMIPSGERLVLADQSADQPDQTDARHWLCLARSPNDTLLACGGFSSRFSDRSTKGIVALHHVPFGASPPTILPHDEWVRSVAFSPDGKILAVGGRLGPTVLWAVKDWSHPNKLSAPDLPAFSLAFSPNGRMLAAGGGDWNDGKLVLYDVESGQQLTSPHPPAELVTSVVFLDGKTLAAADNGGNITFYDLKLQPQKKLLAHNSAIRSLALTASSPAQAVLASAGLEGVVKLWHVATGTQLGHLRSDRAVYSLAFADDGQSLAAGMADGSVTIWRTNGRNCVFETE